MKFNCGLSSEDKFLERRQRALEYLRSVQFWHDWYAWYPVRIGKRDCRWLEIVKRRDTLGMYENREAWYVLGHKTAKPRWTYRSKENKE